MRLNPKLIIGGQVNIDLFEDAALSGQPVGSCDCGGNLTGSVDDTGRIVWVTVLCGSCGAERTAPDGRLVVAPKPKRAQLAVAVHVLAAGRERDLAVLGESRAA